MLRINEHETRFAFRKHRSAVVIRDACATPGGMILFILGGLEQR